MCGRLACRQRQAVYQEACAYRSHCSFVKPELHQLNNFGKCFTPSANLTPSEISPVLVGRGKLSDSDYRQLCPMMWGIIPPWHKIKIEEMDDWESGKFDSEKGWSGPKPLYMAGLYSIWQSEEGEIYSYTVITKESDSQFSWLHHRVPCILTENLAEVWLSDQSMSSDKSISLLKETAGPISHHPVSTTVNNAKNKSDSCNKRINIKNSFITSWLKRSSTSPSDVAEKKSKNENISK